VPLYRELACVSLHLLLTLTYDPIQAHPFALRKRAARSENDNEDVSPTEDRPLTILTLRAAHTNDDDEDVPPEGAGDVELDAAIALVRRRAARADIDLDDDEVSPTRGGDGQLDAAIALICKRAARTGDGDGQLDAAIAMVRKRTVRVDDDDDDVCPTSGSAGQLDAALAFIRRRAARTNDDDDDVSPTCGDDEQLVHLTLRANSAGRHASIMLKDEDDVAPTCGGDGELAVSPSVLARRAARVDDDDDDISPTSGGDGEIMAAPVRRGRGAKSGSVPPDLNDSMGAEYAKGEERLRKAQTKLKEAEERLEKCELELMLCEADERSLGVLLCESTGPNRRKGPQATGPAAEALRAERLLRARQHLGAEQARRQMATVVAKARLEAATTRQAEADMETVAAAQAEREAADASAQAWADVHLARVRKNKLRQRAEAEARAAQHRKEEEARLAQARARLEEVDRYCTCASIELKLCERDERVLDNLISTGTTTTESERMESERMESERTSSAGEDGKITSPRASRVSRASPWAGRGRESAAVAADVDDEIDLSAGDTGAAIKSFERGRTEKGSDRTTSTVAMRLERLTRARERLVAERARRNIALAQTETQREAASAAAKARLKTAAAQLVEAEAEAAAAAQEEKEAADVSASAWSAVHMERVRSFPRDTAASRAEEERRAARERAQEEERLQLARAKLKAAQERLRRTEKEVALCKSEEAALREAEEKAFRALDGADPASSRQQGSPSSCTLEEVVVQLGSSHGEIDSSGKAGPEVNLLLRLEMEATAKEAKEAKREERLQRARGRLGAERARREKAEAETNALVEANAQRGASELGWSQVALRSPTEVVSELGPVQRRNSLSTSSREEAQSAPPSTVIPTSPLALPAQRPTLLWPRSTRPRRRVAVAPSLVSCTHEPPDRRAGSSSQTVIIPDSALAAQRWLSTAIAQASSRRASSSRESEREEE